MKAAAEASGKAAVEHEQQLGEAIARNTDLEAQKEQLVKQGELMAAEASTAAAHVAELETQLKAAAAASGKAADEHERQLGEAIDRNTDLEAQKEQLAKQGELMAAEASTTAACGRRPGGALRASHGGRGSDRGSRNEIL